MECRHELPSRFWTQRHVGTNYLANRHSGRTDEQADDGADRILTMTARPYNLTGPTLIGTLLDTAGVPSCSRADAAMAVSNDVPEPVSFPPLAASITPRHAPSSATPTPQLGNTQRAAYWWSRGRKSVPWSAIMPDRNPVQHRRLSAAGGTFAVPSPHCSAAMSARHSDGPHGGRFVRNAGGKDQPAAGWRPVSLVVSSGKGN